MKTVCRSKGVRSIYMEIRVIHSGMKHINPFMPTVAFNICCPRECVSRTANVERIGGHKWVKMKSALE